MCIFSFTFPVLHCHPRRAGLGTGSGRHRSCWTLPPGGHLTSVQRGGQGRHSENEAILFLVCLLRNLYSRLSGSPVYYRVGRLGTPRHVGSWMQCEFCQHVCFYETWEAEGRREDLVFFLQGGHMGFVRCEFLQKPAKLLATTYLGVVGQRDH